MNAQDEIIRSIEYMIQSAIQKMKLSQDIPSVISKKENGKFIINLYGKDIVVKDGVNLNPNVGTPVWIHVPNGNIKDAYIAAKR